MGNQTSAPKLTVRPTLVSQGEDWVTVPMEEAPVINCHDSIATAAMTVNFLRCGHPAVQILVALHSHDGARIRRELEAHLELLEQLEVEEFHVSDLEKDNSGAVKLTVTHRKLGQ